MNREELMNILPHRSSMLLLDEAEVIDGVSYAKRKIVGGEWFLDGHFPDHPVVPGVVLCEMLAQSVCVCLDGTAAPDMHTLLTGLEKVRFRHPVVPGDVFEMKSEIVRAKAPFYFAKGEGFVNGKRCVSAEFSFALMQKETE